MARSISLALAPAGLLLAISTATATPGATVDHRHLVPDRHDGVQQRQISWRADGAWLVAPAERPSAGGTRVAALVEVGDGGPALAIEARGVDADGAGPWLAMEETFRGPGHRVAVIDLGGRWDGAEIRIADREHARIGDLAWELVDPRYPDAGRLSRAAASADVGVLHAVDPVLGRIGVVSREAWGARPSGCTATEDDWYRMAIHHTAGAQTSGGSVQAALAAVQAYTMDSGNYCDIPYQFLVGYDGSLWEGRSLALRSGATGGGNNDGNIAVSFLGCYHPSGCPGGVSHAVTEEMMSGAHLLVQTLVRLHDIPSTTDAIRGHRDWPGNATACPGDFVHGRLGELRADMAWYAAAEVDRSFPANDEPALEVSVGEPTELWIELTNTGGLTWEPGTTFLATTDPRDTDSPLHDPSWPSAIRVATVDAPVAPGETARIAFTVRVPETGAYEQTLGLVHEQVTWFGDAPWGGGPADGDIVLRLTGVSGGGVDPTDPDDPSADDPNAGSEPGDDLAGGCTAARIAGPGAAGSLLLLALAVGLLVARPTRRRGRTGA
jgi:hypothetical protein